MSDFPQDGILTSTNINNKIIEEPDLLSKKELDISDYFNPFDSDYIK